MEKLNILVSGSYGTDVETFYSNLLEKLVPALLKEGFKITTGMGKNVGDKIVAYSTGVMNENELILRPFPAGLSNKEKYDFRETLVKDCDVVLVIGGQCLVDNKDVNSRGVLEEVEIADKAHKVIIPIGSTGYAASEVLEKCKLNINKYPYLEQYLELLEKEKSVDKLILTIKVILDSI